MTQPIQNEELSNEDTSYERGVLIIYYDKNIGKELLMQEVKSQNATLLYDYTNLNGISIYLPQEKDINKVIKHFEKVKGVLSVSKSQNMQLH